MSHIYKDFSLKNFAKQKTLHVKKNTWLMFHSLSEDMLHFDGNNILVEQVTYFKVLLAKLTILKLPAQLASNCKRFKPALHIGYIWLSDV